MLRLVTPEPNGQQPPFDDAVALAEELVGAWGSWGPTLSPYAEQMAFISDRTGVPQIWVQDLRLDGTFDEPTMIEISDDPVVSVNWSADGAWLACAVATDGGVRTQVWVVRPTGSDARRIAGSADVHAELGPWTRSGHRVTVIIPDPRPDHPTGCYLANPASGELHPLAEGDLLSVLDLSVDEHLVIMRDGQRGKQFCVVVDRVADEDHPLLPYPATGATEVAIVRPSPAGEFVDGDVLRDVLRAGAVVREEDHQRVFEPAHVFERREDAAYACSPSSGSPGSPVCWLYTGAEAFQRPGNATSLPTGGG